MVNQKQRSDIKPLPGQRIGKNISSEEKTKFLVNTVCAWTLCVCVISREGFLFTSMFIKVKSENKASSHIDGIDYMWYI